MNKKISLLLFVFFLFSITVCLYAATIQTPVKARVAVAIGVNIRTGPGTNYTKLYAIPYGEIVSIDGISGSWYKIRYQSYTGYSIASAFTVTETTTEEIGEDDATRKFLPTLLNVDPSTR